MKEIFRFQDAFEIVNDGLLTLEVKVTEAQRIVHRQMIQKVGKDLFLFHQYVNLMSSRRSLNKKRPTMCRIFSRNFMVGMRN